MFIYNTGAAAFRDAQFGPGIGPIFLENLVCSGSETTLLGCRHSTPLGLSTCAHSQDAGVRCVGKAPAKLILSMDFYLVVILVIFIFSDINECDTINGGCEQTCTNAIGSFACSCIVGYLLDENRLNCTGKSFTFGQSIKILFYVFRSSMQMLMNVRMMLLTTAMRMHSASTPREVSPAPAILVTLEMESTVQVS